MVVHNHESFFTDHLQYTDAGDFTMVVVIGVRVREIRFSAL